MTTIPTSRLSFAIDDAKLIEENQDSSFALLSLDFFASGANLHDTFISEKTLLEKADTIKNCPVVWQFDSILQDAGTHSPEEIPCGFIPQDKQVTSRKLQDGRTMLTAFSYIWKKYSGKLLEFFERDGEKPISVEMSVYDSAQRPDRLLELLDYKFEAVTILGSFITPAIPMAKANIVRFSKEYEVAFKKEFSKNNFLSDVDFTIPSVIKNNAIEAIKTCDKSKVTPLVMEMAKFLASKTEITPERILQLITYFINAKRTPEDSNVAFYGGIEALDWSKNIFNSILEKSPRAMRASYIKEKELIKTSDNKKETSEENMETKKEDFERLNSPKPPSPEGAELVAEQEEMAAAPPPKEEKGETPGGEEKEEEKEEGEKNFSLNDYLDAAAVISYLQAETDDNEEMVRKYSEAKEELAKKEFCNPKEFCNTGKVMAAMYAKMCKLAAENAKLKEFRASVESVQKEEKVEYCLRQMAEKVVIPEEVIGEFKAAAEKYSFAQLDAWENECKAKCFNFAVRDTAQEQVTRIGLPYSNMPKPANDIWAGTKK
jgi:hypothetical protein